MQATHKAELKLIPLLSTRDKTSHIFPHLQSGEIIYVGQLCDDGCTATFTAATIKVKKQGEAGLEGTRNTEAGMCQVQLTTPQPILTPTHQSANKLMAERKKLHLAQWYHVILFIPANHTPIQAIKKFYFATWTILTSDLNNKNLTPSMATAKSHMH